MADLLLYGNTQANVNAQPIIAGQLLYTTDLTHNKQYLDKDGTTRVEIGGMDLITSEVDFNAQTASTNKAVDSFILKEILSGAILDSGTAIKNNTTAGQICGALGVKELFGELNSNLNDGNVWFDNYDENGNLDINNLYAHWTEVVE